MSHAAMSAVVSARAMASHAENMLRTIAASARSAARAALSTSTMRRNSMTFTRSSRVSAANGTICRSGAAPEARQTNVPSP